MSISRPFAYNPIPPNSPIIGTEQVGDIAIGIDTDLDYTNNAGGVQWWMGPDEELGYVIAQSVPSLDQPNPLNIPAGVGFYRSELLTESSFISLSNYIAEQTFTTGNEASTWLTDNGYWNSWNAPIQWDVDALAYVEVIENTESVPLTYREKNAVNNLFIRMKGLDSNYANYNNPEIWNSRIAVYPYVGSDVRAFRYNAIVPTTSSQFDGSGNPISPGYQTFFGGGIYDRYGFKGNAINAYANTNLNQTNGYLGGKSSSSSGYTMGVVWKDTNTADRNDFGLYSTSPPNDATMWLRTSPTPFARLLSYDTQITGVNSVNGGKGHWMITKNNLTSIKKAYYQGNELTLGASTNRTGFPTQGWSFSYFVNALNFNGGAGGFTSNTTMFFYMFIGFTNTTIIDAWNQIVEDFCVESAKKTW